MWCTFALYDRRKKKNSKRKNIQPTTQKKVMSFGWNKTKRIKMKLNRKKFNLDFFLHYLPQGFYFLSHRVTLCMKLTS